MDFPTEADVVVVGAGSAGCVVARRLVDHGLQVVLLEAGGEDVHPAIHDPMRFGELWFTEENWGYQTDPQAHAAGRRLMWPRGRVLGGSSSLNAMIWVRATPSDHDHWAYLGNSGWAWADVEPVYRRAESTIGILTEYRPDPLHEAFVKAAAEIGIPFNPDYNGTEREGISYIQFTIAEGRRVSAATAYLAQVRDNPLLSVITRAHAYRLEFEGTRCAAVRWIHNGQSFVTRARHEVVVSAGTIESPRLLMLSGMGEPAHLREHGIDVLASLPGIGANLHDHLLVPVIFGTERHPGRPSPGLSPAQTHLFWHSRSGLVAPDIQPLHFPLPMYLPGMTGPAAGFTLQAGMIRPVSRGFVRLGGADPDAPLRIDARTLSCDHDLRTTMEAVRLCQRMGSASALADEWGARELYPGPEARDTDDAKLAEYVRATVSSYHHQVGTCAMGFGPAAVVDDRLRVHGVDGLRIADASVMPVVCTGNTNAPTIVIGERAAEFIREGI